MSTALESLEDRSDSVYAKLSDGSEITARYAFNVTYSKLNDVLDRARLPRARLKHELAEIALIEPPEELRGIGVTVMDGPFFSCMPFPAEGLHSLTHVRYTPHDSWTDETGSPEFHAHRMTSPEQSRVQHMLHDSRRYLPCLARATPRSSLYDVKTVLSKNEHDDGRPILYQQKPSNSHVVSILGGKIDNVYELFDLIGSTAAEFANANTQFVQGGPT